MGVGVGAGGWWGSYVLRLGRSVLGSHLGLLDGGQVGSSDGQQSSSARRGGKRDQTGSNTGLKTFNNPTEG